MSKSNKSPQERADIFRNKWLNKLKAKYDVTENPANVFTIIDGNHHSTFNSASNELFDDYGNCIENGLKTLIKHFEL